MTVPLATLQHRAERAGDNRLLGPLDPALARDLAAAAARSPASRWELTVVDEHGYAIGHGIARPARGTRHPRRRSRRPAPPPGPALPARVNITITETFLHQLQAQDGPAAPRAHRPAPGTSPQANREPGSSPCPAAGSWPSGSTSCPRTTATTGTGQLLPARRPAAPPDPGPRPQCTWPPCSRPARDSDFEHAIPYDKGGVTDACNAGARSRRCHQVKQMPGWTVTQPKPGWHVWTTPTGRTYIQEPWRYTA